MSAAAVVALAVAGSAGTVARFLLDGVAGARFGRRLPWGTLLINVSGSLLLGFLTGLVLFQGAPGRLTLIAGTGFCGGYTTFSTASVETVRLLQDGRRGAALVSGLGGLAATIAAGGLGLALAAL